MRKYVIMAAVAALSLVGSSAFSAGLIDQDGIEASRAGIQDRVSERFISTLIRGADGWEVESLDADRARCWNYQPVLKTAIRLSYKGQLTEEAVEDAVIQANMPEFCIMYVQNSEYTLVSYQVLLTPEGDILFGYDEHVAYIPWQKVDHLETMFDTAIRDIYTIRGIAPAGKTDQIVGDAGGQVGIDMTWLASQAAEAAAKKRMEQDSVPLPTRRPDITGAIN